MSTWQQDIDRLRREINDHDYRYYTLGEPSISDRHYDELFKQLQALEAEHPEAITPDSPTQRVGEKPIEGFEHVAHAVPMLSIDNTYNEDELREFDRRVAKGLDGDAYQYIVDPKIDGVSGTLRYEKGVLVLGATRGDGKVGDDITANIKTVRAIPLKLRGKDWPAVLEVRGEVYWPRPAFDNHNEQRVKEGQEPFANPRNATSGTLKSLDSKAIAERGLHFIAHGSGQIEGAAFETAAELFEAIKGWGIAVSEHLEVCDDIDAVLKLVEAWDERRHTLDYETDGLVIKVSRFDQREELGTTSRYPRWAIAYKYAAEQGETKLIDVDFQVGKLGTITPRAVMEPVQLSGTTVRHASLHNFDQVERLGVGIGDTVVVEKAGEIIPQVVSVVEAKRPKKWKPLQPPTQCPVCDGEVVKDEGGVYIRCINPECPAQLKERLKYFCGRDQMDIEGLGDVMVEKMVDVGLLKSFADIYALPNKREEVIDLEIEQQRKSGDEIRTSVVKFGEKRTEKLINGIRQSKERSLSRVLAALNIRHVGGSSAELIAQHFGSMEKIAAASEEDLQAVDGVGPEMAASIIKFFDSEAGEHTWRALEQAGVNMVEPDAGPPAGVDEGDLPFAGKTLVVTGTLEHFDRKQIETIIKKLGGKATGSVSKKTDYLVAGEKAGSKLDKAKKLEVKVLSETEFIEMARVET